MSTAISSDERSMSEDEPAPWFAAPPMHDTGVDLPDWYAALQQESWQKFLDTPDPHRKNEAWRFADLRKLRFSELLPAKPANDVDSLVQRAGEQQLESCAAHFVFANNRLIHSEVHDLPEGAVCLPINEALARHGDLVREHFLQESETLGGAKFGALHAAATLSGMFVHLPKGSVCEKPIQIHHFAGGEFASIFPHTLVVAEDNASVSVMETFESITEGEPSLVIGMVDLAADRGGSIQYVALQDESDEGAKHVQLNSSRAGRDARVKAAFLNLGAAWVRQEAINRMLESGSECQSFSANLATGKQEYDQRTLQSHEAQHTNSDLLFKNALYDEARTIFSGLIHVQPGAHHTDAYQTCRNLLGSEKAEANSMPGLEIDADQVKCSHGATAGQISDEEIFYLRARGIPSDVARKMISLGFLLEALSRLDGDEIKEHLQQRVERKFAALESD